MEKRENKSGKEGVCLELIGVGMSFGGIRANNDVNLCVSHGERVAIIGPNGAGKTTCFNMINGEILPTDGQIILFGEDVTRMSNVKRVARGLARTFQITSLFWDQTVIENVVLALLGTRRQKYSVFKNLKNCTDLFNEAEKYIDQVNLLEKKNEIIKNLSYGDQRMVELALALSSEPKIICLDEPNAGLSASERQIMINVIKNIDKNITILLIEHDMDLVFELVDRIMVLHDGEVVATGTIDEIKNNKRVQNIYLGEEV